MKMGGNTKINTKSTFVDILFKLNKLNRLFYMNVVLRYCVHFPALVLNIKSEIFPVFSKQILDINK